MWLYALIMLAVSVLLFVCSGFIYKGRTNLIHDYHQKNVQNKQAYGKDMGKALLWFAVSMFLSGVISLLGSSEVTVLFSIGILFLGCIIGFLSILHVQKKHNGGLF